MSFAVVVELATLVAYVVVLTGGKQGRDRGWRVVGGLLFLVAAVQCAAMAIVVSFCRGSSLPLLCPFPFPPPPTQSSFASGKEGGRVSGANVAARNDRPSSSTRTTDSSRAGASTPAGCSAPSPGGPASSQASGSSPPPCTCPRRATTSSYRTEPRHGEGRWVHFLVALFVSASGFFVLLHWGLYQLGGSGIRVVRGEKRVVEL